MKHPDSVILVFSKAPVAGEVKTRLVPHISYEQAARLHTELTRDCLDMCTGAKLCDVQLWCSPDTQHSFFEECRKHYGVQLRAQSDGDLGERMSSALEATLKCYRKIIIIGSDAPALDSDTLGAVIAALEHNDIALVPAEDGGYVLLGASVFRQGLLTDVSWGTPTVLADTVRNLRQLGLDHVLYGECWDVDRPEDLERYRNLKCSSSNPV
jgi:rSAM/selenodomain-associated transferase 1